MKWIPPKLLAVMALVCVAAAQVPTSQPADEAAAAIAGGKLPPGYRDWRLISVAREEGDLDDIRAILGNDAAIKAYREGTRPFPNGTIIVRLAWSYDSSEENNKAFGRSQSFVAGHPKNGVQFMVKDSKKYASNVAGATRTLTKANHFSRRRRSSVALTAIWPSRITTLSSLDTRPDPAVGRAQHRRGA
jgi:hypothetical protein